MEGGASKKIKDVLVIADTHPLTYFKREDKVGEHCKTAKTTSRKCQSILLILLAAATVAQACFYFSQINSISDKISSLEKRVTRLQTELDLQKARSLSKTRRLFKRQITTDPLSSSEGVPILASGSYSSPEGTGNRTTEGLRIYDAWFQNSNHIPHAHRRKSKARRHNKAIRPHHRKSASWVERRRKSSHNLNPQFDDQSVYRDAYPRGSRGRQSGSAVDLPSKNRAKETDPDLLIEQSLDAARTPTRVTSRAAYASSRTSFTASNNVQSQDQHSDHKRNHRRKLDRNRNRLSERKNSVNVKSLSSQATVGPIKDQFHGLLSAHFVGKTQSGGDGDNSLENGSDDGLFRHWEMSRWAKRMRLEQNFALDDGNVKVKQPGVYFIYGQVNYLDENDVNAFQILVNGNSHFLCTVMTHTNYAISKANTCYTGGVVYLEEGDRVSVRDLEPGRKSVIRPAHTFFGLVQLSGLDA